MAARQSHCCKESRGKAITLHHTAVKGAEVWCKATYCCSIIEAARQADLSFIRTQQCLARQSHCCKESGGMVQSNLLLYARQKCYVTILTSYTNIYFVFVYSTQYTAHRGGREKKKTKNNRNPRRETTHTCCVSYCCLSRGVVVKPRTMQARGRGAVALCRRHVAYPKASSKAS